MWAFTEKYLCKYVVAKIKRNIPPIFVTKFLTLMAPILIGFNSCSISLWVLSLRLKGDLGEQGSLS